MGGLFRALRARNYRLFFTGQSISLIGTQMQTVAMQWLVYRLTHSTALLGVITLVSQFPAFFISPLAGVWLDQWDRRRVLVITQSVAGIQALALAILVYTDTIQVWHLVVLSVILGFVVAFDTPGRQSFLVEMVNRREDLGNAIALNSFLFNITRFVGPVLAAAVIRISGERLCFLLNAISYIAVVLALILISVPKRTKAVQDQNLFQNLAEGWRYTSRFVPIRSLLILLAVVSLGSGTYTVLLPAFAKSVYRGNETTFGWMYSAVGIGAMAGAVMLAFKKTVVRLGTWACAAAVLFSLAVMGLGLRANFPVGLALLTLSGLGAMVNMAATNTLLQYLLEEHMRGRVMAFYTMSFIGTMPLGSFLGGTLATGIGLRPTCLLAGGVSLAGSLWFYQQLPVIRTEARPVLRERGALAPAAADGGGE